MIEWDVADQRYFHHGIDRGVLYYGNSGITPTIEEPLSSGGAVPWNGVTGFDESGNGESSIYYIDGQIYMADVDATDFSGKLTAYGWPDEFAKCVGFPEATDGFFVDNQKPKRFAFSYRSLIGSGTAGDMFGYQIHLVYKALATVAAKNRQSINGSPGPMEFTFDMNCTPVAMPGFRPSAHYVIDTRHLSKSKVAQLEAILYGDVNVAARMPTPAELYDLLNFGSAITFTTFTHPSLGPCWTATGALANVHYTSDGNIEILNVNGSYVQPGIVPAIPNSQYALQDTP